MDCGISLHVRGHIDTDVDVDGDGALRSVPWQGDVSGTISSHHHAGARAGPALHTTADDVTVGASRKARLQYMGEGL